MLWTLVVIWFLWCRVVFVVFWASLEREKERKSEETGRTEATTSVRLPAQLSSTPHHRPRSQTLKVPPWSPPWVPHLAIALVLLIMPMMLEVHTLLENILSGRCLRTLHSPRRPHGFEAWRALCLELKPKIALQCFGLLQPLMSPNIGQADQDFEYKVAEWKAEVSRYEGYTGKDWTKSSKSQCS